MVSPGSSSRRALLVGAVLFVGTVAVFSRSLTFGFINYDDPSYVVNNPQVQAGLTAAGVRWAFAVDRDYWHPLTWISLMADRALFGDDARGYHAVNVAWHALNAVLVFVVARRMAGGLWGAAFAAALFAWHPLRVESVTWITERKDVLSGCFGLVTVWAWLRFGDRRNRDCGRMRGAGWYALALAAFACGLLSKSVLVALPLVLVLLDLWPLGRLGPVTGRRAALRLLALRVAEKAPFLVLALVVGLFTVSTQESAGAFALALTPGERAANAFVSIVRYLGKTVWPAGLAVLYPHPGNWPPAVVAAAVLGVAAVSAAAWSVRRARPVLLAGWGWFIALLLPSLGLVQVGLQSMADRYTYLPSAGLCIALAGLARERILAVAPRGVVAAAAGAALVLAALAVQTWRQQAVWRDADALFAHALAVTRDNHVAHAAVALGRLGEGRLEEAAAHAASAVAIAPDAPLALDTLATVRAAQGRIEEAISGYRRVIELQPRSIAARGDLARLLLRQGRLDEAAALFAEARDLRPAWADAHLGLADVAEARGRREEAASHIEAARRLRPRDATLALRAGALYAQLGDKPRAAGAFLEAAALAGTDALLLSEAGDALGRLSRFADAADCYQRALSIAPEHAPTHARLGYALFFLGRREDAIRSWERALALDPSLTELHERIRRARAAPDAGP